MLYGDTFHAVTQTLLFVTGVTGCLAEERQWSLVVIFAHQQKESCWRTDYSRWVHEWMARAELWGVQWWSQGLQMSGHSDISVPMLEQLICNNK